MKSTLTIVGVCAVIVGAVILTLALFRPSATPPNPQALRQQKMHLQPITQAPDFALPDLNGTLHALSQWRGDIRLLNFWATWCAPCKREIPDLITLQKQFGGRRFSVIGITLDAHNRKQVKQFVAQNHMIYPVLDANSHAASLSAHLGFSLSGLPASVLLDGHAHIVAYHLGPINIDRMRARIQKLIKKRQKAAKKRDRA